MTDHTVKPRRKLRTDNKSPSHGFQGVSVSPVVERSLKNLELAVLADTFRKNHEHTTQLEHAAEKVTLLQQQVDLQKEMLADCRRQRDQLKTAFDGLTSKAKTNQTFLEGLHKDYEKLKRLATTAQENNKKALQAKIAEVEEEKQSLRCELEIASCKLTESQRKMRAVADELYVELSIAHSAKRDLTAKLNELEVAYKSERKSREDIERELLNRVQRLQCQFSDSSDALCSKLEQFQTSFKKVAVSDHQDTKIKECLEILNSFKTAPLLKAQDVRKVEGMLCVVQKWYLILARRKNMSLTYYIALTQA